MRVHASSRPVVVRSAVIVLFVLVAGVAVFWYGLRAFRAKAAVRAEAFAQEQSTQGRQEVLEAAQYAVGSGASASLISAFDGQITGRVTRTFGEGFATIDVLAFLPMIDTASGSYDIWMVRDGLADVVNIGSLSQRADGSWAATLLAGPTSGITDPARFNTLVVMHEYRDGNDAPSGNRFASATWE